MNIHTRNSVSRSFEHIFNTRACSAWFHFFEQKDPDYTPTEIEFKQFCLKESRLGKVQDAEDFLTEKMMQKHIDLLEREDNVLAFQGIDLDDPQERAQLIAEYPSTFKAMRASWSFCRHPDLAYDEIFEPIYDRMVELLGQ